MCEGRARLLRRDLREHFISQFARCSQRTFLEPASITMIPGLTAVTWQLDPVAPVAASPNAATKAETPNGHLQVDNGHNSIAAHNSQIERYIVDPSSFSASASVLLQ